MKHYRQLDWWNYLRLRIAWVRFKLLIHQRLTTTEKIQYAIDLGTTIIHLHSGIYHIQHPITLRSGVKLLGD